jgi:hypothetical protein
MPVLALHACAVASSPSATDRDAHRFVRLNIAASVTNRIEKWLTANRNCSVPRDNKEIVRANQGVVVGEHFPNRP